MTSPELQRTAIQQYADQYSIRIVDWIEGIDESGSDAKSAWWPKLDASIDRIATGEADVIIVWKYSRIGRARLKWAIALDRIDTLGGAILAATEPIETATASGRFARGMLGELNAYQSELIGEQWRETHDRRRRAGLPHGGHGRFGYELVDGRFAPDPVTGPILAEMYRRALRGDGAGRITRWLNEEGISTTQGNPWVSTNLYQMLDGGFGAGLIVYRPDRGKKRLSKSDWTFYNGVHEAVIEPGEWAAYWQRRLARSEPSRSIEARHLLTGLIHCSDCGGRMNVTNGRYACLKAARTRGSGRAPRSIDAAVAEDTVTRWAMTLADDTDALLSARAATSTRRIRSVNDAAAIERRITRIDERMATLTIRQLDKETQIPDAAYQATVRKLDVERGNLTARHQSTELVNAQREADVREIAVTLRDTWRSLATHGRRQALQKVMSAALILPSGAEERVVIVPRWEARG